MPFLFFWWHLWTEWAWGQIRSVDLYVIPILATTFFLKNGPTPASFSVIFVFSNTHHNFITNKCEKGPSSIWCQDSNSQPLEYESHPITTRPGLLPNPLFLRWPKCTIWPYHNCLLIRRILTSTFSRLEFVTFFKIFDSQKSETKQDFVVQKIRFGRLKWTPCCSV